jgi:GAF domain-containing protein
MTGEEELTAIRLVNAGLKSELQGLRSFLGGLIELVEATDASRYETEVHQLLSRIIGDLVKATGAHDGSLLASDPDTGELVFVIVTGDEPNAGLIGKRLPPRQGIAAWVLANKQPVIVNNTKIDERFYGEIDLELGYETRSLLAAPLIGGGEVLGVVEVLNKRHGEFFSTGNQALLSLMCRFAGELLFSMVKDVDLTQGEFRLLRRGAHAEEPYA